ncbi:MAG: FecR domain-containing protein [Pseudomonadales bacterium]|nr:FecR domain-containing protein [Pseudomonadales bacterium]
MNESEDDVVTVLSGLRPPDAPSAAVKTRAYTALHAAWQVERRRRRQRFAALAASVAVMALVAGLQLRSGESFCIGAGADDVVWVNGERRQPAQGSLCLTGGDLVSVDTTQRFEIPAGYDLRLRGGTSLRWHTPAAFDLQAGAAFVATHGTAALRIGTPFGEVRDIGTVFMTELSESALAVSLREGSVSVASAHGRHIATASRLAGERVVVSRDRVVAEALPKAAPAWDWIYAAHPGYTDHHARALLATVAGELGLELVYASADARQLAMDQEVVGIRDDMAPRDVLATVLQVCDLAAREVDGTLRVDRDAER